MTQNKGEQGTGKQSVPRSSLSDSANVLAALLGGLSLMQMQANAIMMAMLTAANPDVRDDNSHDVKLSASSSNASTPAAALVTPGGIGTSTPIAAVTPTLPTPVVPPPPPLTLVSPSVVSPPMVTPVTPAPAVTPVASAPAVAAAPPAPVPGQPLPLGSAFYVTPPISGGPFYVVTRGRHVGVFLGWGNVLPSVIRVPTAAFHRVATIMEGINLMYEAISTGMVMILL
ncbi:hypothetical protein EDD85DRAFT_957852 [Armillaria nabsnona]|nr:hypothetical protein EDD85DRAFT_957852 [Armillaria nabsnona]